MKNKWSKLESDLLTNSLASISVPEMIGLANDVEKNTNRQPRGYIALITLDEEGKTPDLTLKIVSPFDTAVINSGGMETFVMITQNTWLNDWENKPLKNLKSAPTNTRKKTINS